MKQAAPLSGASVIYFRVIVALVLAIALASFVRSGAPLLTNISFWLLAVTFGIAMLSIRAGLLAAVLLLTVSPSLQQQLNSLLGTKLHAWSYPGVDCCLGFLAAWTLKGGLTSVDGLLRTFSGRALLALHVWTFLSAVLAVSRNLWQSASEFSLRGLASHAWLLRKITFQDDYFPLQDLFFISVATAMLFGTWAVVSRHGDRLLRQVMGTVLVGACANAAFAVFQSLTDKGWYAVGVPDVDVNALWPDIHSFGPFMAVAMAVALGLMRARRFSTVTKGWILLAALSAAVGLYLSGSRSTLLFVCLILGLAAVWAAFTWRGWRRIVPVASLAMLLAAVAWLLIHGYRGVTWTSFAQALGPLNFESVNVALSHRPEIWNSALHMYSSFPLIGLGQGAFYRLGSIEGFSSSGALIKLGGSGAHNYFLQTFVELGPIGLVIGLLIALPFVRLGRRNFSLVSFYALVGVALGNVYAHSLLVREMLMVAAIFAGAYIWEATALSGRPLCASRVEIRAASYLVVGLLLVGAAEVAFSFDRKPFKYGQRCYEERPLGFDAWTQGTFRIPIPPDAVRADMTMLADRRDVAHRPLDVQVRVIDEGGTLLLTETLRFENWKEGPREFSLPIAVAPDRNAVLEIRSSHCYVPLNVGRGHDSRHLGVRINKLSFVQSDS